MFWGVIDGSFDEWHRNLWWERNKRELLLGVAGVDFVERGVVVVGDVAGETAGDCSGCGSPEMRWGLGLCRGSGYGSSRSVVASRKGLHNLVRRLTLDYRAVAEKGPQRQVNGLATVVEGGSSEADGADTKLEPEASDNVRHLTEVLDGIEYTTGFGRKYSLLGVIGKGYFAKVSLCVATGTGVRYAVKVYQLKDVDKTLGEMLPNGINALRKLRHENITRLVDVCVNDNMDQLALVMELAPEGELFNYIVAKGFIPEQETRIMFNQLFSALAFIVPNTFTCFPLSLANYSTKCDIARPRVYTSRH